MLQEDPQGSFNDTFGSWGMKTLILLNVQKFIPIIQCRENINLLFPILFYLKRSESTSQSNELP